mgnify:CR=1 FL=1
METRRGSAASRVSCARAAPPHDPRPGRVFRLTRRLTVDRGRKYLILKFESLYSTEYCTHILRVYKYICVAVADRGCFVRCPVRRNPEKCTDYRVQYVRGEVRRVFAFIVRLYATGGSGLAAGARARVRPTLTHPRSHHAARAHLPNARLFEQQQQRPREEQITCMPCIQ